MSEPPSPLLRVPFLKRPGRPAVKIPGATPQWIAEEFAKFPELERYSELIAVLNSEHVTARMWASIRKYEVERAKTAVKSEPPSHPSQIRPLAIFLHRGITRFNHPEAQLTGKERRAIARQIQRNTEKLRCSLAPLRDSHDYFEWSMYFGSVRTGLLMDMLKKLDLAAKRWSEPRIPIYRPSDKNAARLFFIRTVSNGFQQRYGRKLITITRALTYVFFGEDESLDDVAISHLLKNTKKRS